MLSAKDVAFARALATLKQTPALAKEMKSSPALLKVRTIEQSGEAAKGASGKEEPRGIGLTLDAAPARGRTGSRRTG